MLWIERLPDTSFQIVILEILLWVSKSHRIDSSNSANSLCTSKRKYYYFNNKKNHNVTLEYYIVCGRKNTSNMLYYLLMLTLYKQNVMAHTYIYTYMCMIICDNNKNEFSHVTIIVGYFERKCIFDDKSWTVVVF